MKNASSEHLEIRILDLIQAKSKMKAIDNLGWSDDNILNNLIIDELGKLKRLLLKKRRTEPKPAFFATAPQQPPKPIEFYF
jgi:hypothetical protein